MSKGLLQTRLLDSWAPGLLDFWTAGLLIAYAPGLLGFWTAGLLIAYASADCLPFHETPGTSRATSYSAARGIRDCRQYAGMEVLSPSRKLPIL